MIVGSSIRFITKKTKILLANSSDTRQNDTMLLYRMLEIENCRLTGDNVICKLGV